MQFKVLSQVCSQPGQGLAIPRTVSLAPLPRHVLDFQILFLYAYSNY